MSALGLVPGYAFPAFDYAEAEFVGESLPNVTAAGPTNIVYPIVTANQGNAVYVRDIFMIVNTSAVVATRRLDQHVKNGDGVVISAFTAPITLAASVQGIFDWNIGLAQAYSIGIFAYSPMANIVLPPGYSIDVTVFTAQAGDAISQSGFNGLRIPTSPIRAADLPFTPAPLLT